MGSVYIRWRKPILSVEELLTFFASHGAVVTIDRFLAHERSKRTWSAALVIAEDPSDVVEKCNGKPINGLPCRVIAR